MEFPPGWASRVDFKRIHDMLNWNLARALNIIFRVAFFSSLKCDFHLCQLTVATEKNQTLNDWLASLDLSALNRIPYTRTHALAHFRNNGICWLRFRFISSGHHRHHLTPLPDIHCNRYDYMHAQRKSLAVWGEKLPNVCARKNIHTFNYKSRSNGKTQTAQPPQLLLLLFAIRWCRWQCSIFCLLLLPAAAGCWHCVNLQLDLGLQGPKWIFIIYQKTQLPASKQVNERLSESTFV